MEPTITVKNIKLNARVENYVSKKTERLSRYMPNIAEIRVELAHRDSSQPSSRERAQITVEDSRGTILRAEDTDSDLFSAVDKAVDKIYRQIKRYRGKRIDRRRGAPTSEELAMMEGLEPIPEEYDDVDSDEMVISRTKRFAMQPMSAEEAVDQMELLGHDFFMFFNPDENATNLVYRRKNGDYGLLQPELM